MARSQSPSTFCSRCVSRYTYNNTCCMAHVIDYESSSELFTFMVCFSEAVRSPSGSNQNPARQTGFNFTYKSFHGLKKCKLQFVWYERDNPFERRCLNFIFTPEESDIFCPFPFFRLYDRVSSRDWYTQVFSVPIIRL